MDVAFSAEWVTGMIVVPSELSFLKWAMISRLGRNFMGHDAETVEHVANYGLTFLLGDVE